MMQHACCKCPINDSSSLLVHDFIDCHSLNMAQRCTRLSRGRLIVNEAVSNSIPKKVNLVAGPSVAHPTSRIGLMLCPRTRYTDMSPVPQIMRTIQIMDAHHPVVCVIELIWMWGQMPVPLTHSLTDIGVTIWLQPGMPGHCIGLNSKFLLMICKSAMYTQAPP